MRKIFFLQTKPQYMILITFKTGFLSKNGLKGERNEKKNDGSSSINDGNDSRSVLGGCGNSTENNAKTDTNAQNNANTAEIKEMPTDVTEYCRQKRVQSWYRTVCR